MDQNNTEERLNVLLVGEGNFSFSLALCNTSQDKYRITATCYDAEDTICKKPFACQNVQTLRDKGAIIYFGVDATRLKDHDLSSSAPYDRIIFNFPHCGRKAGVKKNRELLAHFFQSCADVLTQKGDIHVALCKGQGGTPADRPMREWHNSWQVASMAARAGFVLSAVVPFASDVYSGYQSTGYRSQEKSFLVDGSLNHIFTRGLPVENMIPLDIISMLMETPPSHQTPEWCDKIGDLLRRDPCHPTNLLNDKLVAFLGQSMILNHFKDTFPLVRETCVSSACPWQSESQTSLYYTRTTDKNEIPSRDVHDLQEKKASCDKNTYVMDVHATCDENTDQNFRISYLRPSLTHCIDCIIKTNHISSNSLYVLSGPVFRKCLISPWIMPVYRETLIMLGFQSNDATAHHQLLIDAVEKAIMSLVTFTSSESFCFIKNELESCTNVNPLTAHHKLTGAHYTINMSAPACNGDQVVGRIISVLPGQLSNNFGLLLVTINIDLITLLLLDVPDWRLLWTADARFMQQYKLHQLKPFQTLSLYPPYYVHDVSFWVGEGSVFDDIEFHTIVQRVSKGTVVRIQLQDRFENSTARKTSLCYRVIYQSCDRALSYEAASAMQLLLREELQRCLSVTLR